MPNFFLALRCIKFPNEPSAIHYDKWPSKGFMQLNQTKIQFEELIDPNSRRLAFERFLTRENVKAGTNDLYFETSIPEEEHYYFGIYLVKKNTADTLKSLIQNSERLSAAQSKQFIQENFASRKNQKSSTVSLTDDQGHLMETPVRAKGCKHITCFSLECLIQSQIDMSSKRWNCPICKNRAYHLVVDEYFIKIISKYKGSKLHKYNVTFYRNGAFEISSGVTKGQSTNNAICIEDIESTEGAEEMEIVSSIREAIKANLSEDFKLSIPTIPSPKTISSTCPETGNDKILLIKDLHEFIMNLYDPLALFNNNVNKMNIEAMNSTETLLTKKQSERKCGYFLTRSSA